MQRFIMIVLWLTGIACSKNHDTNATGIVYYQKDVTKVEGVSTIRASDTLTLVVSYFFKDGCDKVAKFEETKQGKIRLIKAMGGYPPESICQYYAGSTTVNYHFTTAAAGTYQLRFLNRDGSFITHTVFVY